MEFCGRTIGTMSLLAVAAVLLTACATAGAQAPKRCVVVWSEGTAPKRVYPDDINGAIAEGLTASLKGWEVVKASIDDPEQGLPDELLNRADVLIWWGHKRHDQVNDELVAKVVKRVKEDGMGFISLHSSHFAKPNKALMDSPCTWGAYVGDSTTLDVTVKTPDHPIAKGVQNFTTKHSERYSDPYAVPEPEAVVFEGVHTLRNGEKDPSRVGLCWHTGKGKFFYFQAGHETNPIFFDENVRTIMSNAVEWAAPEAK
ncbi:MAG: Trehalose utilization protein ThuA [Candidatus Hydrogenedentes bacterium]|nr:Trehalose utilization protein ThuA [Candidatus Hydrogenedentota bacterium]